MQTFKIHSEFRPTGDQPQAIEKLAAGLEEGQKHQVLLGVTGSGKTYTMANVIAKTQRPALILAHNKTLAAQLYAEFAELFPDNAVEYFVSYYDYYQPEAYVPTTDTYIQKDSAINERIDKMRHAATRSLLDREDCIIIASVSCIYGLGSPEAYHQMLLYLERGMTMERDFALKKLTEILYKRSEFLERGRFRVRGDVLDIFPVYEDDALIRVEFFGDEVAEIYRVDSLTGEILAELKKTTIYPASHYVVSEQRLHVACDAIEIELAEQLDWLKEQGKNLEAQRLEQRTRYDLELLRHIGTCQGIENYSRHMEAREPGSTPPTLMDYLPRDVLLFIDESHVTVPQVFGMYSGDRSRKETLVRHGFRLPSALDNRPLNQQEFERIAIDKQRAIVYVSATPGPYELAKTAGVVVEQIVRPTGLADPPVEIRPARDQIIDVEKEIKKRAAVNERTLVTTLTKRMAEDLADYLRQKEVRVRYMHADIETIERTEIIKDLRLGKFDCLIGINLLREGLDIPEVSLVAILDADKEGFLRSANSLIQTVGRAARNLNGMAILYADAVTDSMQKAIDETNRRRAAQVAYNQEHGITPRGIEKKIGEGIEALAADADYVTIDVDLDERIGEALLKRGEAFAKGRKKAGKRKKGKEETLAELKGEFGPEFVLEDIPKQVEALKALMKEHAQNLEFEKAATLRDEIRELEQLQLELL